MKNINNDNNNKENSSGCFGLAFAAIFSSIIDIVSCGLAISALYYNHYVYAFIFTIGNAFLPSPLGGLTNIAIGFSWTIFVIYKIYQFIFG